MALNKILRFFCGYVRFRAEAGSCERLINLCATANIELNNLIKIDDGFEAQVLSIDFAKVKQFSEKANVNIFVVKKSGVVIGAMRFKKRWGIMLGALLCLGVLIISQNFIWDIQVSGNSKVSTDEILLELESIGIKKWSYIPNIDFREKKQLALLKLSELSWLSLNISGCRINVLVAERCAPPALDENDACDIVAAKTGQIRYMEVYNGIKLKKVNYTVMEGETLVSGTFVNKKGVVSYVHSDAKIIAEVQFEKELSIDLEQLSKAYTGEVKKRNYLTFLSVDFPLFIATKLKGDYDFAETEKPIRLFGLELPMTMRVKEHKFYTKNVEMLSIEQAIKVLEDSFKQYELGELGDTAILQREVTTKEKDGVVTMKIAYIAEQNIAKKQLIEGVENE